MKIPTIALNWIKPVFTLVKTTLVKTDTTPCSQVLATYRFTTYELQVFPLKQAGRSEMLSAIVNVLTDQQKMPEHWRITWLPDQQAQIATPTHAWILRLTALQSASAPTKKAELPVDPLFVGPPKPIIESALIPKKQVKNTPVWNVVLEKLSK